MNCIKISLGLGLAFLISLSSIVAQDEVDAGKKLFEQNCTTCHKIGEKVIGPNLEGVTKRHSQEWILGFIKNSAKMVADGDDEAVKIWKKFGKTEMTAFEGTLSDQNIQSIIAYLKVAKPEKKQDAVSNSATTESNVKATKTKETGWVDLMKSLSGEETMFLGVFIFIIVLVASVLTIIMFQLAQLIQQVQPNKSSNQEKNIAIKFLELITFQNIQLFTGVNRDQEIPGHNHDGITELDNGMPPWLAYFFYATIAFAAVYLAHYRVFETGMTGAQEYETEMAEAALKYKDAVKVKIRLLTDNTALESGKQIYAQNCASCHKSLGEGGIGPNLTDEYWIHGGKIEEVFNTIRNGVPAKGMIAWKGKLSDEKMLEVASFVKSLKGTNPPNAKAPQGDKE